VPVNVEKLEAFTVIGYDVAVPDLLEERLQWLSPSAGSGQALDKLGMTD